MSSITISNRDFLTVSIAAFLWVASLLLYIFAPPIYSNSYCIILLMVFVISSLITIRFTIINKNYFSFHLLFLISIFFVNFVYPVFIYPVNPYYFPVFRYKFDHDIISKATALALLGSCSYNLGVVMRRHKAISQPNVINTNFNTIQFFLNILLYLSFVGMLIYGGIDLLKGHYNASMKIPPGLLLLFQIILGLSIIFAFRRKYYKGSMLDFANKFNKPVIPVIVLFSLMFIFSGDRGPVIQIALIALVSYTLYVKPMRMKSFILIIFAGMFFLTIISYARIKSGYDKTKTGIDIKNGLTKFKIKSFYDVGMDLIINNRNLYTGYEHEKINGMNYGKSLSYQLFAPFPILPSLFTHIMFNTDPEKLSSSYILTKESKASYGLGTNIIIDLFMAFGPVGVILCMLFLGLLVTRIQLKASTGNSLNYVISYIFLVSLSIYMPRSTILDPLRPIIWALFIYNLLLSVRLLLIKLSHADSLNGHTNPKEIT